MTLDVARDIVLDVSYFGTMMVHSGHADGMVSGAAHSTAHTITPGFEIIKTAPGTSSVSSVFFMCLADRVLVYGDCAVIPDPTVEQLADIAIVVGGHRRPVRDRPARGDAVVLHRRVGLGRRGRQGPGGHRAGQGRVARTCWSTARSSTTPPSTPAWPRPSCRARQVAGRATVFIFPDLNTGNNTYKAVQRSAGAVAVGPVLQGLNKPVNDLSRGATVRDIVNTVAITAIQAQAVTSAGRGGRRAAARRERERPRPQLRLVVDQVPARRSVADGNAWPRDSPSASARMRRGIEHILRQDHDAASRTARTHHEADCETVLALFDEIGPRLSDATSWRSATASSWVASTSTGPALIDAEVRRRRSTGWRRSRRSTTPPTWPASASPATCLPDMPHVAVFDTASSTTCRAAAATYALDREIADAALASVATASTARRTSTWPRGRRGPRPRPRRAPPDRPAPRQRGIGLGGRCAALRSTPRWA